MQQSSPDSSIAADGNRICASAAEPASPRPLSWPAWLALVYAGLVLPAICFLMTVRQSPDPPRWQSHQLRDYAWLLLSGPVHFVFYPFLLYAMVSLALILVRPARFSRWAVWRFGVYSGVLVAAQFSVILGVGLFNPPRLFSWESLQIVLLGVGSNLAVWIGWWAVCLGGRLLWRAWRKHAPRLWAAIPEYARRIGLEPPRPSRRAWWLAGVGAGLIATALVLRLLVPHLLGLPPYDRQALLRRPAEIVATFFFLSLLCAPFWACGCYLGMSLRLLWPRRRALRVSLLSFLAAVTWLATFLAATRMALARAVALYAQLPTEPQGDCYVATAAAHGHPWLVGSRSRQLAGERTAMINRQLQRLKCGELLLRELMPHLHRAIRGLYDRWGPSCAGYLHHRWAADLAYLGLKLVEWPVALALRMLLGHAAPMLAAACYRGCPQTFRAEGLPLSLQESGTPPRGPTPDRSGAGPLSGARGQPRSPTAPCGQG